MRHRSSNFKAGRVRQSIKSHLAWRPIHSTLVEVKFMAVSNFLMASVSFNTCMLVQNSQSKLSAALHCNLLSILEMVLPSGHSFRYCSSIYLLQITAACVIEHPPPWHALTIYVNSQLMWSLALAWACSKLVAHLFPACLAAKGCRHYLHPDCWPQTIALLPSVPTDRMLDKRLQCCS